MSITIRSAVNISLCFAIAHITSARSQLTKEHCVSTLCQVLKVNRSTYYKFINHRESKRDQKNACIRTYILLLYAKYKKRLGAAKMKICLQNEYCINISIGIVYRLMKSMSLPKISTQKPFVHKSKAVADGNLKNVLHQQFNQPEPNLVWVCDFTYIRAAGRFYYLCAILDLFSRKVIAHKLSDKIDTQLAIDTVNLAVANRGKSQGVIFHSDRGSQFTSADFRKHLDRLNIVQSFSAKAHPYDNAVMECFFKYLKKEEINRKSHSSFKDLNISLFEYFFGFYNSVRPHSHNNGLSPNQAEALFL